MNYLDWNTAIATHFFNSEGAHRPVYVYVTPGLINQLGESRGSGVSDFVSSVVQGPPWITDKRLSLCGRAHRAFRDWRTDPLAGEREYPPYLAYLALFVLAAGSEGDFAAHAYYPRLGDLLGEAGTSGMPAGFNNMWELWLDLEEWSKSDRNGELGEFDYRVSGEWQHVGLPVAQTLLSESDRRSLPQLFSHCALDPTAPPTDAELLAVLRRYAVDTLQRRTRNLLASADSDAQLALVQAVGSELEHWDGSVDESSGSATPSVATAIRLCCHLDPIAMTARMRLRCKAAIEFPEAGLVLVEQDGALALVAEDHGFGWSSEISSQRDNRAFDAASLDWTQSLELRDDARGWRAVMQRSPVRVFRSGASVGLPGYIEVARITRGADFLIAACQHLDEIREWGAKECMAFAELDVSSGLPANWHLFEISSVASDTTVRDVAPRLALASSIRIQLSDGIAAHDGSVSRFFSFARPTVIVDGPTDGLVVTCNGTPLDSLDASNPIYELPSSLPLDQPIRIEATTLSGDRSRRSIQLVDAVLSNWQEQEACFGPIGERLVDGGSGAIGSSVEFAGRIDFDFGAALIPIPTPKAFLIGCMPGQVWEWPFDTPPAWAPAWVVIKEKRNLRAKPCMVDVATAEPVRNRVGDQSSVRRWKQLVSRQGRRFNPPSDPELLALWDRYRKVARSV